MSFGSSSAWWCGRTFRFSAFTRASILGLGILGLLGMEACSGGGGGGTGGGGGGGGGGSQLTTPTVTVTPGAANLTTVQALAQMLAVTVTVSGTNGTPAGSVTLSGGSYSSSATTLSGGSASFNIPAGSLAAGSDTLSASYTPSAASASTYNSSSGTGQVTVSKVTPTVSGLPQSASITTTQSVVATVSVSGGAGAPTATGTVTVSGGSYTSTAATLSNGSATITVPAGALGLGPVTLTAAYTPDTAGSAIYSGASGTGSVTVELDVPSVTVTPNPVSITVAQPVTVTVSVSGGAGAPTATGQVTLSGGNYSSTATALTNGSASITVAAGVLAAGTDTLTASYAPDATSSSTYANATGTAEVTVSPVAYTLTVDSGVPASGITISASPSDNNGKSSGSTPFTLTYNSGTQVTLSAVELVNGYTFSSWSGCGLASATICNVTVSGNTTVTATYTCGQPTVSSITVSPNGATIGTQQQFTATVNGSCDYSSAVTWAVAAPAGSSLSPGDISSTGLYNTPYPAPATVTVTATSVEDTSISGSATVTLSPPAATTGPTLNVDVNTPNTPSENPHTISSYVYGMNAYALDATSEKTANPGLLRWGGDDVSRYNYQNGWTNTASDWYFENYQGAGSQFPNPNGSTNFTQYVESTDALGVAVLGTVPVNGWVSNGTNACSFLQSSFPNQLGLNGDAAFNSYNGLECGYGYYEQGYGGCTNSGGCEIFGSNTIAALTSNSEPPPNITDASATPTASQVPNPGSVTASWADSTWSGGWVNSIVTNSSMGNGASGKGVAVWDLDNEPTWWSAVHRDVHPIPFTYNEVTDNGMGTALAIKSADPTALVSGPVIDNWWAYFYSETDVWDGYDTGPCYEPWSDPVDREAHGGVPLMEYYLQQFNNYSQQYGVRLLDYLDIHGYFAPDYPAGSGNSVAFTTAGDTQEQEARMNGTRVFWDPTYTDPNFPQPNYITDPNYTTNCSPPAQAPELIPMLQAWVNGTAPLGNPSYDYPGTKTSIDEYNFGGMESMNGAVVEADILGIFGRQGLNMSALWPTEAYSEQGPGNYAFAMYRNYDGNDSMFGSTYLYATSSVSGADAENQLAVYGAQRSSDNAITVMVINKTYGSLSSTINLENFSAASGTNAQVYQYSSANLTAIVAQAAASVTPPSGSGTTSTVSYTFPAQSITLLVVPD